MRQGLQNVHSGDALAHYSTLLLSTEPVRQHCLVFRLGIRLFLLGVDDAHPCNCVHADDCGSKASHGFCMPAA